MIVGLGDYKLNDTEKTGFFYIEKREVDGKQEQIIAILKTKADKLRNKRLWRGKTTKKTKLPRKRKKACIKVVGKFGYSLIRERLLDCWDDSDRSFFNPFFGRSKKVCKIKF